jgi:negative regulator of sigma E activity
MKWLLPITAVAVIVLLAVVFTARRGESAMGNQIQQATTGAIPAIDAAAPAQYETATFAAG